MPSNINPNNIDITYPIAGQDNDTQGFRDNFRNLKNNLSTARTEISALQDNLSLVPRIRFAGNVSTATVAYPLSSSDSGIRGQIAWGPDPLTPEYLYICVATGNGELGIDDINPRWVRANVSNTW